MKRLKKTVIVFAILSAFVAIAGVVYTAFGRGVSSPYMSFAFLWPLILGLLGNVLLMLIQQRTPFVGTVGYRAFNNIYNFGIAVLTVYCALRGVFDIFGTVSYLLNVLMIVGFAAIVAGVCVLIVLIVKVKQAIARQAQRRPRGSLA